MQGQFQAAEPPQPIFDKDKSVHNEENREFFVYLQ